EGVTAQARERAGHEVDIGPSPRGTPAQEVNVLVDLAVGHDSTQGRRRNANPSQVSQAAEAVDRAVIRVKVDRQLKWLFQECRRCVRTVLEECPVLPRRELPRVWLARLTVPIVRFRS